MRFSRTDGAVLIILLLLAQGLAVFARAQEKPPHSEVFAGGLALKKSWFTWAGGVTAVTGNLHGEGWRARVLAGYGRYSFTTDKRDNSADPALLELMAGYQFKKGPLISKLFAGLHVEQHKLVRPDPNNKMRGTHKGIKLLSENWIDLPAHSHLNMDVSWSSLRGSYQGQLRAGSAWLWPDLALGPELQVIGNDEHFQLRLGGFARWQLNKTSLEVSGGLARDFNEKDSPYGGLSMLHKF